MNNYLNGVWRETSSAFVDYIERIDEQVFHFLDLDAGRVLYIDKKDSRCSMDGYMQSFIEIFQYITGVEKKDYCLVFLPDYPNEEAGIDDRLRKLRA